MTIEEASRRYQIPLETLQEYERFGLCSSVKKIMGVWQYDDEDLERMSMIMTLHEVGFESQEVETYMQRVRLHWRKFIYGKISCGSWTICGTNFKK